MCPYPGKATWSCAAETPASSRRPATALGDDPAVSDMSSYQGCEACAPASRRTPPHGRSHPTQPPAPHLKPVGSSTARPPASGLPRERATPPSLTAAALTATAFVHLEATPRQPASPEPAGATGLKAVIRRSSRGGEPWNYSARAARVAAGPPRRAGRGLTARVQSRDANHASSCRCGRSLDAERSRPLNPARPCSSCSSC